MENQILKTYGLTKDEIQTKLSEIIAEYHTKAKVSVKEKYLDATIDISSNSSDTIKDVTRLILNALEQNIYATGYETLYEKLASLLKQRNKTICLFEQGSGGVIASNLMAIDGAGKHVQSCMILPSVDSWLTSFDIDPRMLRENNGVSSKLVFMIASALRRKFLADYYIVSVSSDADGLEVYNMGETNHGLSALVAIGDAAGVEIYKQKLTGSVRDRINQTAKSITYKLILELKK